MNIDDVLLTNEEHSEVFRRMPRLIARGEEGLEPRINKAQCLKLLRLISKKLYEICPHKTYPEQRNRIDCTLCVMEIMSELESVLKEG